MSHPLAYHRASPDLGGSVGRSQELGREEGAMAPTVREGRAIHHVQPAGQATEGGLGEWSSPLGLP